MHPGVEGGFLLRAVGRKQIPPDQEGVTFGLGSIGDNMSKGGGHWPLGGPGEAAFSTPGCAALARFWCNGWGMEA